MNSVDRAELVALVRSVVAQVEPSELPFVDGMGVSLFDAVPDRSASDGALGFGGGSLATSIAAAAVAVNVSVVLEGIAKDVGAHGVRAGLSGLIKVVFGRKAQKPDVTDRLREQLTGHAKAIGLSNAKAELMADAFLGSLRELGDGD